ncbi:MAG: CapA family protein [bacterium]
MTKHRFRVFPDALPWMVAIFVVALWAFFAQRLYRSASGESRVELAARGQTSTTYSAVQSEGTNRASLPSVDQKQTGHVNMLVVGDIMLGRYVETLMKKNGNDYPFANVNKILSGHDIVLGNLEGPIDTYHTQTLDNSLHFSFSPDIAPTLKQQGFSFLGVANNHSHDQGTRGVDDTRAALTTAGIIPLGDSKKVTQDFVVTKTINDQEMILVGMNALSPSFPLDDATTLIKNLRLQHPDAFLLLFPHWGTEYAPTSTARQRMLGHAFIDAGADAVVGHHPHVVEEAEVYRGRLILYSLGNFIFDQYFSTETQEELAVELVIQPQSVRYSFHPLISEKSQPKPMNDPDARSWLSAFAERSSGILLEQGALTLERRGTLSPAYSPSTQ